LNFHRLLRADAVAMVAALALLLVMALDWYSTGVGDRAREIEKLSQPGGQGIQGDQAARENAEAARFEAQSQEKNAWQVDGAIDRLILIFLLGTIIAAVAAAWLRAAGRRFEPPATPTTAAAVLATISGLLVAYRILQEPGFDSSTTVKAGAPLALVVLGVIALAARAAMRAEADGSAWAEAADPEATT
jgi:hypothetical protein